MCFATAVLATKAASNRVHLDLGFLVALVVNVLVASIALTVQLLFRGEWLQLNLQAVLLFAGSGLFATYLGRWFFYESVVRFGPAKASVFQIISPLFAAVLAWLFLDERLGIWVAVGMGLAMAGLVLVAYKPGFLLAHKATDLGAGSMSGKTGLLAWCVHSIFILGLFSSAAYAVGNLLRGAGVRSWPEPIAGGLIAALSGLAIHYFFSANKISFGLRLRAADRRGLWLFALVGIANISGQIATIASMRYIPLAVAALVGLCTPLLVFPISYWLFKNQERLTVTVVSGGALTLVGMAIVVLR